MEFQKPSETGFTIYSKSGCQNCVKVKNFLRDKNITYNIVDCDEYIFDYKDKFLLFIQDLAEKECKQFPMVFFEGKFVGGYQETVSMVEKRFVTFEENLEG